MPFLVGPVARPVSYCHLRGRGTRPADERSAVDADNGILQPGRQRRPVHHTTAHTSHVYVAGRSPSVPVASAAHSPPCRAQDHQDDPDNDEDPADDDGDLVY